MSEDANDKKTSQGAQTGSKSGNTKVRGKFKVVFKGMLRSGFNKADVISNIVRLTKIPKETVEKKFFSGKAVVIRRAHDEPHAQKLQQLFSQAGLEVIILKEDQQVTASQIHVPRDKTKKEIFQKEIQKKLKKTLKTRRRPMMIVLGMLALVIIALQLWNQFNISVETPESVVKIEQSLANEALIGLAHVNVERLLSLHSYFVDDPDALPGVKSGFYNNLKQAGIDPQKSVKQLLSASYMSNKSLVTHHILLGEFPVQALKRYLQKNHHGKLIADPDFIRLRIAEIDPVNCQQGNFKEVSIEADRILISSEGFLDDLRRLLQKEPGNATDLSRWAEYRSDKLVSAALFKPNEGARLGSDMVAMMAQGMVKKNKPLDSIYVGISMQLLPPGAQVDVSLNSAEQAWLDGLRSEFEQQVETLKNDSQGLDNLQMLLSKLSIRDNQAQLSVNLQLDRELKQAIEASIQELAEQMVSLGASVPASTALVSEVIDDQALQYAPVFQASQLTPFNEQTDQLFTPAWIEGPFAAGIDELLMENDQVVMQLRAKGQNIENMGDELASLSVVAVRDKQGNNILEQFKCAQDAHKADTFFSSWGGLRTAYINNNPVKYTEIEARNKVKLKPGVNFSSVAALEAMIDLNLATKTKTEIFAKPQQNKIVSAFDTRLLFKSSDSNTLTYTISGDEKRVLTVRALNDNKQYLSRSSSSSMGSLWGAGRSVTKSYQGTIAFIEVVYAAEMEKLSYPVTITKFPPYYTDKQWKYDPEPVTISSLEQWNDRYDLLPVPALEFTHENSWQGDIQAQWHKGPFNLALYGLKDSGAWGTTGQLKIKTPVIDELRHNLSALEVFIQYPQAAENGDIGKSYFYQLKASGHYMNGAFVPDQKKPYMEGELSFSLPVNNDRLEKKDRQTKAPEPVTEIKGEILVNLPVSQFSSHHSDIHIGAQWENAGVKTKIIRMGNDVLEFEISGSRDQLLQIVLFNAENERISTADVQHGMNFGTDKRENTVVVNYQGIPVKARLSVAEGKQVKRYPFKLTLNK